MAGFFRAVGRRIFNHLREARLYPALFRSGPRIAVLPWSTREASSLLRGYNIAEALNSRGWNAIVLPKQITLSQRRRVLRLFHPQVALLLKSRHPDNTGDLLTGIPYLYDLDDADFHSDRIRDRMERDVAQAAGVIAGSHYIAAWCRQHNPATSVIWTGTPDRLSPAPPQAGRPPVVTWAQSAPFRYLRELAFVTDVLHDLGRTDFIFRLYGCTPEDSDHPHIQKLRARGITVQMQPLMPYDAFLDSLEDVAVGLCPLIPESPFSRGKSFGKVLAYIRAGVPVIASDQADHSRFFTDSSGIVSDDPDTWRRGISELLDDPERRGAMATEAYGRFVRDLTTEAAATRVEALARQILDRPPSPRKAAESIS
jgi:hypothetical protein